MKVARYLFEKMISLSHLFDCWTYFRRGKRKRKDIQQFERYLEDNIFQLREDLVSFRYQHDRYEHFYVSDPKQRRISKATVRDRLVHQMVYAVLTEVFDKTLFFHSLSSRLGKGTHVGVSQLHKMIRKVSGNGVRHCYALKMDIKRFFDSINHGILKGLIRKTVLDEKALKIIDRIIDGFMVTKGVGIPLGNVTSQLFANIYLHELDTFIKHSLKEPFYLRYCDDFIIVSTDVHYLRSLVATIGDFLKKHLRLELHPKKVIVKKLSQGIDFVGYVIFSKYILLRTRTSQRMKRRLNEAYVQYLQGDINSTAMDQRLQSYLGILSHANQYALSEALKNAYWVRSEPGAI